MSWFELDFAGGTLRYKLWETDLARTWARVAESYYRNPEFKRENLPQNFEPIAYLNECETLKGMMREILTLHRAALKLPDVFTALLPYRVFTRDNLNYLHGEYEYMRTFDIPFELPEAFNDQIHVCERFHTPEGRILPLINERPRVRTRFIHKDWGASAPWKLYYRPEDYASFTPASSGRLYLCYCEVGKPPFSAWRDRDTTPPVPWTQYGPAFYVTFQNWNGNVEEHTTATEWLEQQHGPGVYWMGEPELGLLTNVKVEEAYWMVKDDPTIRAMRWSMSI